MRWWEYILQAVAFVVCCIGIVVLFIGDMAIVGVAKVREFWTEE